MSGNRKIKMLKDAHLIEAALNADKIVISLDDEAKNNYSKITNNFKKLKSVVWVNPVKEGAHVINWLQKGAKPKKSWQLG